MNQQSKLRIWTEEFKTTGADDDLYLKLMYEDSHDISLVACNKNGEKIDFGSILTLDLDYKIIIKRTGLNEKIDLLTDFKGTPLVEDMKTVKDYHHDIAMQSAKHAFMEMMKNDVMEQAKSSTIN